ncbi:glycerol-3-phosphate responsive antiterminator [Halalkalibacillus halophilus]|uniref:glycerol-3-phosphate responsive antiterminator n=1 Tax=Halalkalibacillus halophilus TaxID=392827 RepID=UPI000402E3C9|nr:glycerol-3-phosphate responsive antiterminator [Halalkalibacillus halophilus]
MNLQEQKILPAIKSMKDFERMLKSNYKYGVFLELHISQVKPVMKLANQHNKKMFLHVDLIQGLKNDEYAAEYLCQEVKPYGLVSTKASVILIAKKKGIKAIQRIFILDSNALQRSVAQVKKTQPDYIEILPGLVPKIIQEIHEETKTEVFAGGLIDTPNEVNQALIAGATAITTSDINLWKHFEQ